MYRNGVLPGHDHEFADLMNNEQWCISYLFNLRWPDGFICPFCKHRQPQQPPHRKIVCRYCGKLSTVTSGTLLHGSKKQINAWFKAIWWLINHVPEITIKGLQEELGFTSYQTAWTWMGKLRFALQIFVNEKSGGTVVVGPGELPGRYTHSEPHHFLMAAESIAGGRMIGKVQMARAESVDTAAVLDFTRGHIRYGSSVVVPNREPFSALPVDSAGYVFVHDDAGIGVMVLQEVMRQFSSWYGRKKYRPANRQLMQGQLNEFCFMQTVHLYPDTQQLFDRLLTAVIEHGPVFAHQFTGSAARDEDEI